MGTRVAGNLPPVREEGLEGRLIDQQEWFRPSPRLASMRQAEVAAVTAVVGLVAGSVFWALASFVVGLAVFAALVGVGFVAGLVIQRRVRAWAYAEREDDLLVGRGILVSRLSVVPYGRMQFVDVTAGPVERLFGLVTVRLHTAAAASDARIPGLSEDTGARLRDRLASLGEARASGL
jgi:membrane protein YdbS with pleckstrin-like domain